MSNIGKAFNSKRYPTKINQIRVQSYEVWRHMVVRCGYHKTPPNENYTDVTIPDSWQDYSNFHEDVKDMVGYGTDFVLDKDLLIKGNRVYCKENCCFVPEEINVALTKSTATRGVSLIGVDFHKKTGKFRARHKKHLGLFNTEIEAFNAYKEAKENYLKELADKWKDKIDPRAYNALMNYQVDITD